MSQIWKDLIESVKGSEQDFTTGKIGRAILLLTVPMVLEMVMESLFAIVDIYFVSSLGAEAIAAVGLTESLMAIIYSVGMGLGMAATGLVSRRIGEKNSTDASWSGAQTLMLGLIVSVFIAVPGFTMAEDILGLMGATEKTIEQGRSFTSIMLGGNAMIMLLFINNAVIRSAGDAAVAMRVLWLANGINIILDPCLIFGWGPFPELGLMGAAVATSTGRGLGIVYQFYHLIRGSKRIRMHWKYFIPDLKHFKKILKLSAGGVGQFLIATASWIGLYRIMAVYGEYVIAGYTVALRLIIFTLLPAWGISNAAATLVGQNLGAGKPERAEKSIWITGLVNTVYLVLLGISFYVLPERYIGFFNVDQVVMEIGTQVLRILSLGYLFYGFGMVVLQSFNGAGDTLTPTWLNLICFWFIELPMAFILARHFGMAEKGVFVAVVIAESLLAVMGLYVFVRGKWKLNQV
ncbi:MAG: MATE family efflux transporter [Bacteroidales bacterium]|nr:MATE family efflux transporter [Bacteroidales bacterium]